MKTRITPICLCAMALWSCTDWQAEYQRRLAEAIEPLQEKINYIRSICEEVDDDCTVYDSIDDANDGAKLMIATYLPDEQTPESTELMQNMENALLFSSYFPYFPYYTIDINPIRAILGKETDLYSLRYYLAEEVDSKESMEYNLRTFDEKVVQLLNKVDYLVVGRDVVKIKPRIRSGYFTEGGITCSLTLYDLNTFEELNTHYVSAVNSDRVVRRKQEHEDINNNDLMDDLTKHLRLNILQYLKNETPVRFQNKSD